MTYGSDYPFSDLTAEQIHSLMDAARQERAQVIRSLLAGLFSRKRQSQAWPNSNEPALSLTVYR